MPEGFPRPSEVTDIEAARLDEQCESLYGPVVAAYTPHIVTPGDHPDEVKAAWVGVRMTVREHLFPAIEEMGYVQVDTTEAYNALVVSGAPEHILQYWIDCLSGLHTVFGFHASEGSMEVLDGQFEMPMPSEVYKYEPPERSDTAPF